MAATDPAPTCPTVTPDRLFPSGSRHPAGAVVKCPHCRERHWLALSSASRMARCPKTFAEFALTYGPDRLGDVRTI